MSGDTLGARPAGGCTCDRAATENAKVTGETCGCGLRAKGWYLNVALFRGVFLRSWIVLTLCGIRCLQLREGSRWRSSAHRDRFHNQGR